MAAPTPVTSYLIFYNFMQFVGWGSALFLCLRSLRDPGGYAQTYQESGQTVSKLGSACVGAELYSAPNCIR